MNGLRVYTRSDLAETRCGSPVFYSRRQDGPYYRWSYNDGQSEWQVNRVLRNGISSKILLTTTWKTIPTALKRSIVEHYED